MLGLLLRATLGGVNSGGVSWSKREYRFRWKSDAGRVSGLGPGTTSSSVAHKVTGVDLPALKHAGWLRCSSISRPALDGWRSSSTACHQSEFQFRPRQDPLTTGRPLTPTHHSLLHALSTCLAYVKQDLTASIERAQGDANPTMIKWTVLLQNTRELLSVLCDIIQWASPKHKYKRRGS